MDDDRDPPIEEPGYVAGLTVVNIGDVRVARGMSRRHHSSCPHRALNYDQKERRIWCKDCEHDVESFEAFLLLAEQSFEFFQMLERREKAISEAEQFKVRTIAAKNIDAAWRKRDTVPACPHCSNGLFPESFKGRYIATIGKDYALARLGKKKGA